MNNSYSGNSLLQKVQQTVTKPAQKAQEKLPKLPKVRSNALAVKEKPTPIAPQNSPRKLTPLQLQKVKLPIIEDPLVYSSRRKGPQRALKKTNLRNCVPDPRAPTPRLSELINAVVETSRKLIQNGTSGSDSGGRVLPRGASFTVKASHHRHHHKKHKDGNKDSPRDIDIRCTRSSERDVDPNRNRENNSADESTPPKQAVRFHSSTDIKMAPENKSKANKDQSVEVVFRSPSAKECLSKLPQDSCEDLVTDWIKKSSSQSSKETFTVKNRKIAKSMPVNGRRSSIAIMKNLATRRFPMRTMSSTKSNRSSESDEVN